MTANITIAVDAMGGDHGPQVVVPAALGIVAERDDVDLILCGDRSAIESKLEASSRSRRLRIQHAPEVVEMDEPPARALRSKRESSMRLAIDLVHEGQADACISAGNTGALMAIARFVLKTLPGVSRPAIISALPTIRGQTHVLDLGANIESTPRHLLEFAVMGSALTSAVDEIDRPRVGLLNIGQEVIKGNEQVREAAQLLEKSDLNYIGFVEGDGIYQGAADVVVCDGFVGNIALKSSEGVARMISDIARREFRRNPVTRLAGLLASPVLRSVGRRMDPRRYNGASFVGLRKIVIKSHGSADVVAWRRAILEAVAETGKNVPGRIGEDIAASLDAVENLCEPSLGDTDTSADMAIGEEA